MTLQCITFECFRQKWSFYSLLNLQFSSNLSAGIKWACKNFANDNLFTNYCLSSLCSISSLSGTPLDSKVSASYIRFLIPFVNFDEKIQKYIFLFFKVIEDGNWLSEVKDLNRRFTALPPIDMGKKIKGNGAMAFTID